MITGMVLLTLVSLGCLLYVGYRGWRKEAVIIKSITSICFVLLGGIAYRLNPDTYGIYMLGGLAFGALGDILLGVSNQNTNKQAVWFVGGVSAFSVAHLIFIMAFVKSSNQLMMDLLMLPVIIVMLVMISTSNKYFRFNGYKGLVIGYSLIISIMLASAINIAVEGLMNQVKLNLIIIGASLFVVSDIILCIEYFYIKKFKWAAILNLITYYIAEVCLALSILY
ncbi:MAG: lysoplasmalogenase [Cellulosilyticaceae bacterium]